jgi:WD40 repeat protein
VASNSSGLKVIEVQSWQIAVEDNNYAGDSQGAAFAPDGRLYTVAFDGKLRQYGPAPDFKKEREVETKGGKLPSSVAVDPLGQLVAVGFNNSTGVDVYDAATLNFRFTADIKPFHGIYFAVTWSSNGESLVAAGKGLTVQAEGDRPKFPLVTFGRDGEQTDAIPLSDNTIYYLQPCGDAVAVTAADPAFGLVDGDGKVSLWETGVAPEMRRFHHRAGRQAGPIGTGTRRRGSSSFRYRAGDGH